jgi:hypothetical protein
MTLAEDGTVLTFCGLCNRKILFSDGSVIFQHISQPRGYESLHNQYSNVRNEELYKFSTEV